MVVTTEASDPADASLSKNWVTIDLADYGRSRDEIDKRSALSAQLLNFQIILVAAVLSGYDKIPKEALIGVSCLSSVLWLMWIDHTSQIYKIAAYVELVVARRLRLTYPGALGWERFLRDLDTPGTSGRVLGIADNNLLVSLMRTEYITRYIGTLFLGSALGLAFFYSVVFWDGQTSAGGRIVGVLRKAGWLMDPFHTVLLAISLVLLWSGHTSSVRLRASCKVIENAIKADSNPRQR